MPNGKLLTDTACKNAQSKAKPYKLGDMGGLYLYVVPKGGKYWRVKYRYLGKEKVAALGVYPLISLTEAREKRDTIKKQLLDDKDPVFEKQQRRLQAQMNAGNTFEVIAREWHDHYKDGWVERHSNNIIRRLEKDAFPVIGRIPIAALDAPTVLAMVKKIDERGAHDVARRTLQMCGQVFTYAIGTNRAQQNPITNGLTKLLKPYKKTHFAAIDVKELPDFIKALKANDARLHLSTRLATELLMLTLVRTSELIGAKWNELDLEAGQWNIPGERMKMRRPHIVPLSRQAVELFKRQKKEAGRSEYVFPNQSSPKKTMSNATILGGIKRMGYQYKMTGHGFRALGMTAIKEKLRYPHEVIDLQLAHLPGDKLGRAYNRVEFIDERRKMMQAWADFVDSLSHAKEDAVVTPFPKAA
jgi:integrase